jgi:hypothetical protein
MPFVKFYLATALVAGNGALTGWRSLYNVTRCANKTNGTMPPGNHTKGKYNTALFG